MKRTTLFRQLLKKPGAILMPVAHDVLTAKLIEGVGFEALSVGGLATAATRYGLPDVGLIGLTEVREMMRLVCDAVEIPVLADADTGYGNGVNVTFTVKELEKAGAATIFIEDQVWPKRCGHMGVKELIPVSEMQHKIRRAIEAKTDPDFLIMARTDGRAVNGLEEAIGRARAYVEAGAEAIFVEAPQTIEEVLTIPQELPGVPLLVNMMEGGKTPLLPKKDLEKMGYKIIAYPLTTLLTEIQAVERSLLRLKEDGWTQSIINDLSTFQHFKEIVRVGEWLEKS